MINMKWFIAILILTTVLIAGCTQISYKACTMEAKLCPDGSYVGRTPPNCDFAPCPSEINCSSFSVDNCPTQCVICPPCEVCSSISCQTEEFCKNIGFNRSWWESVRPPNISNICKGNARCFNGTVTRIVDGDTLYVNNDSIRLTLVNASEIDTEAGKLAKTFVSSICPVGSTATVDEDDGQTGGSYGRIVAVVYCNGKNLNAELLANGKATVYEEFCDVSEFANEDWVKNYGC